MRSTTLVRRALVVAIAAVSIAGMLPAQDAAKEVTRLEEQWITSAMKRDGAGLGKLLADTYVGVTNDGRTVDKAWAVKDVATDTTHLVSLSYSGVKAHQYGNTVVITGTTDIVAKGGKGNVTTHNVWIDTWIKQADGRWLCVASQGTLRK